MKLRLSGETKKWIRRFGLLLIVAGVVMLLYVFATDIYAGYQQRQLSGQWKRIAASESDKRPSTADYSEDEQKKETDRAYYRELTEKQAFAKLVIPKIGLDVIVVEGTEVADLKKGPGHMRGSAPPGQGNTVISGHRVTYSRPFFRVDELAVGDPIILYTPSTKYEYRVIEKRIVVPTDVSVIQPTNDIRLTLTACHPPYSARYRIIIIAKLLPRKISPRQ